MTPFVSTFLLAAFLVLNGVASAATITVTTGSDPIDIDWQTATVADLPGPDGTVSFSEAMIAANNTPGHDTVEFAIPASRWELQWLYAGYPVIYSSYTYFWRASESVTIDGTTQTAFSGDTNPDGAELIFYGGEIFIGGGNCTVTGLHRGAISVGGSNNLIEGNSGGINISVFGGTGTVVRGNKAGTIKLDGASNTLVVGNTMQRVRIWGGGGPGLPGDGNIVGGPDPADRNYLTGYGYTNSEGLPSGTTVELSGVSNTVIENNWIGTTVDGLASGNPTSTVGIGFSGTNFNTTIRDNRIAGIRGLGQAPHWAGYLFGRAVMIAGSGEGITLSNNTIGLDVNDEPLLGSVTGIDVGTWSYADAGDIQILDNVVAGHVLDGIVVGANVAQARISRNLIFANAALGIDLIPSSQGTGLTPNDPLDTDTGGNGLQNFPTVSAALTDGARIQLEGELRSSPGAEFTLEFFASPGCDGSGHGQGQMYLGAHTVTTDAGGVAPFDVILFESVEAGWVVTATATSEPLGATSEFGACTEFVASVLSVSAAPELPPVAVELSRPWPNPANPRISVKLSLARGADSEVRVLDARGRVVATLLTGYAAAGAHVLQWDGRDAGGREVSSGIYFVKVMGTAVPAQRFTLLR